MKKIGAFLLASHRNAAIVVFLATLLPLIKLPSGFIAAIVIALVTLSRGPRHGFVVLLVAGLMPLAQLVMQWMGIQVGFVYGEFFIRCALVYVMAALLGTYASWRLVLEVAMVLGFVGVLGLHLFVADPKAFWVAHLTQYFGELKSLTRLNATPEQLADLIHRLSVMATGLWVFIALASSTLYLIAARYWQSVLENPGAFKKEFVAIRMGQFTSVAFLLITIGMYLKVDFCRDFFPVMLFPFALAALSLLHSIIDRHKTLFFLLIMIYVGLFFLPTILVLILALLGFIDSWWNFRKRVFI